MVLELNLSECVSDPVVIAEVLQNKGVGSNPAVLKSGNWCGVVNLNFCDPKLLCDPPLQGIRQVGGWV